MSSNAVKLEDLRREIDEIDAQLHELLIRRTEVSRTIGKAKERGRARIRPAREAQIMRQLVARHRGTLPKAVLLRIWREIISDSAAQQGPFSLSVYVSEEAPELRDLAREFFGVLTPMAEQGSAVRVLNEVASGTASLGILPPVDADNRNPWWLHLARDADDVPRIVGRLPFAPWPRDRGADATALVVALGTAEPSGHDRSFLVAEVKERMSRARFKDLLVKAGLSVRETATWSESGSSTYAYCLAEVEGYLGGVEDAPLADLLATAGERIERLWPVGSYPVPLGSAEMSGPGSRGGRTRR
jgi:chorismate mutase